jgi:hypothetical protein
MHTLIPALGLALWAGFLVDHFAVTARGIKRFVPLLIFIPILFMWGEIYAHELPTDFEKFDAPNKVVKFLTRKYPNPAPNTVFLITNWNEKDEREQSLKKQTMIVQSLRLAYHREDVSIYPANSLTAEMLDSTFTREVVILPIYVQEKE